MRYISAAIASTAIAGALFLATPPASAQVGVEVGVPGVGVRIGDPDYRYREDRRRVRERVYEDDNRGDCRTVTVQRERRDGTMVTRQERRCD